MNVAKLEIVLPDGDVERAKEIIFKKARTGRKGDGFIYVSPVTSPFAIVRCIDNVH